MTWGSAFGDFVTQIQEYRNNAQEAKQKAEEAKKELEKVTEKATEEARRATAVIGDTTDATAKATAKAAMVTAAKDAAKAVKATEEAATAAYATLQPHQVPPGEAESGKLSFLSTIKKSPSLSVCWHQCVLRVVDDMGGFSNS